MNYFYQVWQQNKNLLTNV